MMTRGCDRVVGAPIEHCVVSPLSPRSCDSVEKAGHGDRLYDRTGPRLPTAHCVGERVDHRDVRIVALRGDRGDPAVTRMAREARRLMAARERGTVDHDASVGAAQFEVLALR